ncbi:MAG: protein phosphatase, partial [Eggerthellaceae bacterium]
LQPGAANRLQGGIRVDNLEAAHKLVAEYRSEIDRASGNTPTGEAAVEGASAPDTTGAAGAPAPKTEG